MFLKLFVRKKFCKKKEDELKTEFLIQLSSVVVTFICLKFAHSFLVPRKLSDLGDFIGIRYNF